MSQIQPYGARLAWAQVPAVVHDWVEQALEAEVIEARSQQGGFSPGVAQRVVAANGRRAFFKAVSPMQNPDTPDLLRRERDVLASMPARSECPPCSRPTTTATGWACSSRMSRDATHGCPGTTTKCELPSLH